MTDVRCLRGLDVLMLIGVRHYVVKARVLAVEIGVLVVERRVLVPQASVLWLQVLVLVVVPNSDHGSKALAQLRSKLQLLSADRHPTILLRRAGVLLLLVLVLLHLRIYGLVSLIPVEGHVVSTCSRRWVLLHPVIIWLPLLHGEMSEHRQDGPDKAV